MASPNELSQIPEDVKRNDRIRRFTVKTSTTLAKLICTARRDAGIAGDKGYHIVSPEATRCVKALRMIRNLPSTPRDITKTRVLLAVRVLATNGNPKIGSEARSVADHLEGILANGTN